MSEFFNELKSCVTVHFWEGQRSVHSFSTNLYPNYKTGDLISVDPVRDENNLKRLHVIEKIIHSVLHDMSDDFTTFYKLEIHLKNAKIKNEPKSDFIKIELKAMEPVISEVEKKMILLALDKYKGDVSKSAKALGLTRRGFYLKLERYEIK